MRRLLSGCVLFGLLATPAAASTDLRAATPVGLAGSDTAALAAAGDVNGDGIQDVAIGLQDDIRTREPASLSEITVIAFGPGPPDPSRPGFSGLVISHLNEPAAGNGQFVGGAVAGVGDWDGDGLGDVAFGAIGAAPNGRANAGSIYIVLGRRQPGTVDVRTDPRVVRIDGAAAEATLGADFASAGDFDGDGHSDLVLAQPRERAVIVRGGAPAGTTIDLARPPAGSTIELRGLDPGRPSRIGGRPAGVSTSTFVPAGDVDGDGRGELLVGVTAADPGRGRGRVFVVRGAPGPVVDAGSSALARIVGPELHPGFGGSLATLPDTDGDGRPEWIIGSMLPGTFLVLGEPPSGAFVVFSSARGEVRPGRSGQPAVTVDAKHFGPRSGGTVAGIPDATGDGVPDLLIGLPDANAHCRERAGAIALVPGRRTPGTVRVGRTAPRVDGPYPGAELGATVAFVGTDVFAGSRPFENAAALDLWRVPAPTGDAPALPDADDCLDVDVTRRSRAALARGDTVRVRVRSDAGDGRAHRLRLQAVLYSGQTVLEGRARTVRLPRAGTRRATLPLPRGAARLLARRADVSVAVIAEQQVGTSFRTSSGASGGDGYVLKGR